MSETKGLVRRDKRGRFLTGSIPNPSGDNQWTTIFPLLEALEKEGARHDQSFWEMVAQKSWSDTTILNAVLKKLLPDKKFVEGQGFEKGTKIIIIRPADDGSKSKNIPG